MASRRRASRVTFGLSGGEDGYESQVLDRLAKSNVIVEDRNPQGYSPLVKSILNQLNGSPDSVERIAFDTNPTQRTDFGGVYKAKLRLIPDDVLKRIAIQDSLVSNIVRMRQNHVSSFGRPRPDRFSLGYIFQPNTGVTDKMSSDEKKEFDREIKAAIKLTETCGHTEGVPEISRQTFAEYLSLSTRSALVNGRIATEILSVVDDSGEKHFHRFLHTDSGTIYKAGNDQAALQNVREAELALKQTLRGNDKEPLEPEPEQQEPNYVWVQVIEGKPVAVFTDQEMKIYNFYAVGDIEMAGYPVTPIDTVISAITTHINIVTHNKLYFQSGRASRGMLVIKSDDVTPQLVHNIKQTFNASINNVNNAWRMPVFGVGQDEEVTWAPIDTGGGRDMEFQYLTDMNAREILTAFQMSPDEMPGWTYLSRGTNSQALSEGNNEYKLEAARDVGIRPILHQFEDFFNTHLLPLIAPKLVDKVRLKLVGLEADNAEKESVRLTQDQAIWETYDGILQRVEQKPVGKEWGGEIPLNPTFKSYLDFYFTVGEVLEQFCGRKGASKDPMLAYRPNQWFFQWLEYQQSQQQAAQQAQQAAQAPVGGGGGGGGGGNQPPPGGGGGGGDQQDSGGQDGSNPPAKTEDQKSESSDSASGQGAGGESGQGGPSGADINRSLDEAYSLLTKAEGSLPASKRRLLAVSRHSVDHFVKEFTADAAAATAEILAAVREATATKKN